MRLHIYLAVSVVALGCPRPRNDLAVVELTPQNGVITRGGALDFKATGVTERGEVRDVTAEAVWQVEDGFVAALDAEVPGRVRGLHTGSTKVRATVGGVSRVVQFSVVGGAVVRLEVNPPQVVVPMGLSLQVSVNAVRADDSVADVTSAAFYSVMGGSASVSVRDEEPGVISGVTPGSSDILVSYDGVSARVPVEVTTATVRQLTLSPPNPTLPVGASLRLSATASLSDGRALDVTEQVAWTSSSASVAFVSLLRGERGLVTAVAPGTAELKATLGDTEVTTLVTVTNASLERVAISPPQVTLAKGTQTRLTAHAVYSDGTRLDVTALSRWTSNAPTTASVSSSGVLAGLAQGPATVHLEHLGRQTTADVTVSAAELFAIEVSPAPVSVAAGTSTRLTATGRFSDGSVQDLTEQALWTSSDGTLLSTSNSTGQRGVIRGLRAGDAELVVAVGSTLARVPVTVTAARLASLMVAPAQVTLPRGASVDLVATGVFTDGSAQVLTSQVTWSASRPSVAAVDAVTAPGRVTAAGVGTGSVRAELGGVVATVAVEVTAATLSHVELSPAQASLARGSSRALTATGVYSDASRADVTALATWSSDDAQVASVSSATGVVQALAVGQTAVRASFQGRSGSATVTVSPAALTALSLSQTMVTLPVGFETRVLVTGHYSDGSTQDLSSQATWSSADAAVASASNASGRQGTVRGVGVGATSVTATHLGQLATATVTVSSAVLTSLALTPPSASLPRGTTQAFVATGTYSDGSTRDVTAQSSWSASSAALSVTGGVATGLSLGQAEVVARIGTVEARATITVTAAVLVSLGVTPAMPTAPLGVVVPFVATGTYSDGSTQDLTSQVTWASSSGTVASISNASGSHGRATALAQGSATISASAGGSAASVTLTVTAAALATIEVTPPSLRLAAGTFSNFSATGRYTDGATQDLTAQVVWSVSDAALASASNAPSSPGRVQALQAGQVQVRATRAGVTGEATLTVHGFPLSAITLTPATPSAAAGLTQQLTARGTFADASTQDLTAQVTWASSDGAIVSVSNAALSEGLARALTVGTATVTATALGQAGSATFTVTAALLTSLEVTPVSTSVPRGLTHDFVATGRFSDGTTSDVTTQVTWASSAPAVATVSNAMGSKGRLSALSLGTTRVSAVLSGQSADAVVTVTPAVLQLLQVSPPSGSVARGLTLPFSVTGVYSDGSSSDVTEQVSWSSSAPSVAQVSNVAGTRGVAQGVSLGMATVTATSGAINGSANLTVTAAVLQQVQLSPVSPSVPRGLTRQLTATGVFSDGSTQDLTGQVAWGSSDTAVAIVSTASGSEGLTQAMDLGVVTISATHLGRTGTTQLTVTQAVLQVLQVAPVMPSVASGLEVSLTATGVYSDSTTQDLTSQVAWSTSDAAVATVSNASGFEGTVRGRDVGAATISASLSGVSGDTQVTVTPSVLLELQVTPANASRPRGLELQLTATGVFSDGSTQDLTSQVTWSSSDTNVAPVSNASGSHGRAVAQNVGGATLTATYGVVSGSTPFTVTTAALTQVDVSPTTVTLPLGTVRQFHALGRFTDGTTQTLTSQATWASTNQAVLDVSNATGSEGLATTIAIGTADVTLTYGAFSAVARVTITQAALASIELNPSAGTTPLGFTRQFIAIGHFTDGTTQVLTAQATWSSNDPSKAIVSNASSSRGLLSTVAVGSVTVDATFGGVTGSTTHVVSAATLVSLTLAPASVAVPVSGTAQLTATGHYSDGSFGPITSAVTFTSAAPTIAQVSNASGSEGLVTGIAAGSTSVTAQLGSVSGSVNVTVGP